jgi:hypothetical protein
MIEAQGVLTLVSVYVITLFQVKLPLPAMLLHILLKTLSNKNFILAFKFN